MNQKLSKRNKIILAIVTVSLLAVFSALTYAYFSAGGVTNNATESNVVTLTSNYGNIIVRYLGGNIIQSEDVVLLEDQGDSTDILKFSIQNTGTVSQDVIVHWEDLVNGFCQYQSGGVCTNVTTDEDVRNELNYTLYECNSETVYNSATESNLTGCTNNMSELNTTVPETESTAAMHTAGKITVAKETTKYYVFQLTIENLSTEQNYNQNKSMSGKIMVDYPPTLAEAIETKYTPVSDINIDFSYTSNGCNDADSCAAGIVENTAQVTNGLYINNANGGDGTIKYFRGTVNNYVEMGVHSTTLYSSSGFVYDNQITCENTYGSGNCPIYISAGDPILWRVIRVDYDNSVRIITDKTAIPAGCYSFNCVDNEAKYVGYTTDDTNTDRTDGNMGIASRLKSLIDAWYINTLETNYINKIKQNAEYCNDISGSLDAYGARIRLIDNTIKTPTYNCPNSIDDITYGGIYQLSVATITADEMVYGGAKYFTSNLTYYLNNETRYWVMSPFYYRDNHASAWRVTLNSNLIGGWANDIHGARPVITLNANTLVTGQGTSDDPWIVQ